MNVSLTQDFSIYKLATGALDAPNTFAISPEALLATLRAQIDLLIEQQIPATLWVKLPKGNIWHSEIERYQKRALPGAAIYTYHLSNNDNNQATLLEPSTHSPIYLNSNKLQREYFLIIVSPKFCSLIVALRPSRSRLKKAGANLKSKPPLVAITSYENHIIQQVTASLPSKTTLNVNTTEPALLSNLLAKQMRRQEEISQNRAKRRIKILQQQNQKLCTQLQHKDDYLTQICQELRTPVTHMKTALSLFNSPALKTPQRQRYQQMLNNQCDRQTVLISGVLELVQLEQSLKSAVFETVRLSDIIPVVVSTYQPLANEKGIMLAYTVPTELPPVSFVIGGLRQIMINLLANSITFTPEGGQVWVKARSSGEYVYLEIRDTGIGIAESELPKIFNRFYSHRPPSIEEPGGAGLGLSVVQYYLEKSGASISVKSKPMEGSTFTVQLAVVPPQPSLQGEA
ncbi:histidine kinase [Calothrix sp. NIES-4071]|nr:histidine kinase [Calothrix sp. NIES-4071]BAZ56238.1 histidine kinase [Calothrix sp. NIES-4105]